MKSVIVSDLHIGSRYFVHEEFERFLASLPEECELILNGDIIDNPYTELPLSHRKVLDHIKQFSRGHKVVWLRGNHDNGYIPVGFGKVDFRRVYSIAHRLLIIHGDDFDDVMPKNQAFMKAFKLMHNVRVKLGAEPVHVAYYAKNWEMFYRVLRKNVMTNALKCAMQNGYEVVTCGHTHYAEDRVLKNGTRYINTGAWTELPAFYLLVIGNDITLEKIDKSPATF